MTRFAIILGALALPAALAAQEPTPRDTVQRRGSEPVFLSADSVAKLRAAAEQDASRQAAATAARRAQDSIRAQAQALARDSADAEKRALAQDTARAENRALAQDTAVMADTVEARAEVAASQEVVADSLTTALSHTPTGPNSVWLQSTTSGQGTLSRGLTQGPDGRVFARPVPDGGVWMVAIRDSENPEQTVSAPVGGVTQEESAGEVAPALSTSVRTSFADMSRIDIRELQGAMTDAGCSAGAIDGLVGPRTRHAIACVQRKYDLPSADLTSVFEALNLRLTSDMQ